MWRAKSSSQKQCYLLFFSLEMLRGLIHTKVYYIFQKQRSRGVLRKRYSENMLQIYRRTPMTKCDFKKVAKQLYFRHVCSPVTLRHIFRTYFPKKTSRRLVLIFVLSMNWRNDSWNFKCSYSNKPFLKCVYYWYNLIQWIFFILYDNWKTLFFIKDYSYCEGFSNRHLPALFERSVLKRSIFYVISTIKLQC